MARTAGHTLSVVECLRALAAGDDSVASAARARLADLDDICLRTAEQLVLSPRTIEAHVRNIYGKLGVRSRVELARSFDASLGRRT